MAVQDAVLSRYILTVTQVYSVKPISKKVFFKDCTDNLFVFELLAAFSDGFLILFSSFLYADFDDSSVMNEICIIPYLPRGKYLDRYASQPPGKAYRFPKTLSELQSTEFLSPGEKHSLGVWTMASHPW